MSHAGRYKPRKKIILECANCGGEFQATRDDAKFCSATCRKHVSRSILAQLRIKRTKR